MRLNEFVSLRNRKRRSTAETALVCRHRELNAPSAKKMSFFYPITAATSARLFYVFMSEYFRRAKMRAGGRPNISGECLAQ